MLINVCFVGVITWTLLVLNGRESLLNNRYCLKWSLDNHYKMINRVKGVLGANPDRIVERFNVKHCTFSLLGEPIIYPEINKFVKTTSLSSNFIAVVTNAKIPQAIQNIREVILLQSCISVYIVWRRSILLV